MEEESTESQWAAVAFMTTPEFLYFHSILIGLQVACIVFMCNTDVNKYKYTLVFLFVHICICMCVFIDICLP